MSNQRMPRPTIDRIVHYVSHGTPMLPDGTQAYQSQCRAAMITEVNPVPTGPNGEYLVGLFVVNPTGVFFRTLAEGGVEQDQSDRTPGTWHWPEAEIRHEPEHRLWCCCEQLERRLDKMEHQLREILRRLPDPATVPAHITLEAS